MLIAATLASLAIVTQDQAPLRAAPRDSAAQQTVLWQGDSLEIRAEKGDFLQVWDHRRERGGYIRSTQVRSYDMNASDAQQMLAIMRFVHDSPGKEALGIGYSAAFLRAAPPEAIGPEAFDALGTFSDRLAQRASISRGKSSDTIMAAHLEVAASYGIGMNSFERDGRVQICYNGEAFRRVLALPQSSASLRAQAALVLTRHDCISPDLTPMARNELDNWRKDILEKLDTSKLNETLKNRILMRRAGVWSAIAFSEARKGKNYQDSANHALQSLAAINKKELTEDDANSYSDAATRVGAIRWAVGDIPAGNSPLTVSTRAGQAGETCIQLNENKRVLIERCTYGIVWTASASVNPQRNAVALAVQPQESWRELWFFHQESDGWKVDVIPPSSNNPDVGYIEFAGWVPGSQQFLTSREFKNEGRYQRRFEIMNRSNMQVERWAEKPESLSVFYRWQDARWKQMSINLR